MVSTGIYSPGYCVNYAANNVCWATGQDWNASQQRYCISVIKSVDAGATWASQNISTLPRGTFGYVSQIAGAQSNTSIAYFTAAVGRGSGTVYKLYKTTNGGSSWSQMSATNYTGRGGAIYIDPANANKITIGSSAGLYTSTNGGRSFTVVASSYSVTSLDYSRNLSGLILSTNKGLWIWKNCTGTPVYYGSDPSTSNLTCAMDTDDSKMLVGTRGRAVWSSYCGSSSIEDNSDSVVPESGLSISPNPVTSNNATLNFSLEQGREITVGVFDISGRSVSHDCVGAMDAGEHELVLDTTGFTEGVYFAVVTGDGYSVSGRFVVYK